MSHILIADDDMYLNQLFARTFERAGYKTIKAYDGHQAIDALTHDKPDLVLLDLLLPGVNGIGVLKFIRSTPNLADVPVYIISSSTYFSGIVQAAWVEGATRFIQKGTLSPNSLVDEIRKIIPAGNYTPPILPQNIKFDFQTKNTRPKRDLSTDPKKILIADDDPTIHSVLTYFLGQDGFKVLSAFNGSQALMMAQEDKPDVLVLDVSMPGKDGFETLEDWKRDPKLKRIPVIMLTASQDDDIEKNALFHGAAKYLTKPFSPDALVNLANEVMA